MIWFRKDLQLKDFAKIGEGNMGGFLGIEFVELGPDYLKATMPVNERTRQPFGLLHGGASVALAETLGSVASALVMDRSQNLCLGLEINANHIRSAISGFVTGTCSPIHIGASTHVWDIRIHDQQQRLICISRITVAILKKNKFDSGAASPNPVSIS